MYKSTKWYSLKGALQELYAFSHTNHPFKLSWIDCMLPVALWIRKHYRHQRLWSYDLTALYKSILLLLIIIIIITT